MDDNLSERQQLDAARAWVRENAPWALAGIVIGVGALVGWQQWQGWQERRSHTASEKYEQTLQALGRNDREAATKLATQLKSEYSRTPYGDLAELALARFHVDAGRFADAAKYLADVMETSDDAELRVVARLRLARVQRAAGSFDDALATLSGGGDLAGYAAAYAVVRGDVLLERGDRNGALAAYREALAAPAEGLVDRDLLQMKIDDLAGGVAVATPAGSPAEPAQ